MINVVIGTMKSSKTAVLINFFDTFQEVGMDSVVVEVTGSEDKIASLIRLLEPFGILELVRTGLTAMTRGNDVLGVSEN